MSHELAKQISQPLIDNWLNELSPKSRENYIASLKRFGEFAGEEMIPALARFLALDRGNAFLAAKEYKAWLVAKNGASSTVNQRLSALRSFVSQCFDAGLVGWQLNVKSERAQQYKDTRGPGEDGFLKMLEYARSQNPVKAARDVAILKLLYGQAFRRGALENLNLEHLEEDGSVWIHLKGHRDLVKFSLSKDVCAALNSWIEVRGDHKGPFFNRVTQSKQILPERLKGGGIWHIIKTIGKKVNLTTWPHGLRHAAITSALDKGFDAREVMRFSGHTNIQTVLRYDDNRKDFGKQVAEAVSEKPDGSPKE